MGFGLSWQKGSRDEASGLRKGENAERVREKLEVIDWAPLRGISIGRCWVGLQHQDMGLGFRV